MRLRYQGELLLQRQQNKQSLAKSSRDNDHSPYSCVVASTTSAAKGSVDDIGFASSPFSVMAMSSTSFTCDL